MPTRKPVLAVAVIIVLISMLATAVMVMPSEKSATEAPAIIPAGQNRTVDTQVPAVVTVVPPVTPVVVPDAVNQTAPVQNVTVPAVPVTVVNVTAGGCTDTSVPNDTVGHATIVVVFSGYPNDFGYVVGIGDSPVITGNMSNTCPTSVSQNVTFPLNATGTYLENVSAQTFPLHYPMRIPAEVQNVTVTDGQTSFAWF